MKLILSDRPLEVQLKDSKNSKMIDLSSLKIANCTGCFGCWTKTPGKCVIRDDAVKVYPQIAESEEIIYVSRIKYGGYDTVMKTMLERAIPVQQAFIRILNGETHHVQRNVVPKKAVIIAYGADSQEERDVFEYLVERNASNMSFSEFRVIFTEEDSVDEMVRNEVKRWQEL